MREVAAGMKKGEFDPAYYLHGPEALLKDEAIGVIVDRALDPSARDFNLDTASAATLDPDAVEALCHTLPMMADRRVVVIRDVEHWKRRTRTRSAVLRYLERPSPSTVLVLVEGHVDDSAAPDKELLKATVAVACDIGSERDAMKWLVRQATALGLAFEPGAAEHLLAAAGASPTALRPELEKFRALPEGTTLTAERVGELVGVRHGETALDWRDAVMDDDTARAIRLLDPVLAQRDQSGVRLLTLLGTTIAGAGVARAAFDQGRRGGALERVMFDAMRAARPFGLGDWKAMAAAFARWAPQWDDARLRHAARAALAADRALKTSTVRNESAILADLVLELTPVAAVA